MREKESDFRFARTDGERDSRDKSFENAFPASLLMTVKCDSMTSLFAQNMKIKLDFHSQTKTQREKGREIKRHKSQDYIKKIGYVFVTEW